MSRILITGAAGLIGSAAKPLLEKMGHEVVGIDINTHNNRCVFGDIRSPKQMHAFVKKIDGIIHLAAISRVVSAQNDPVSCFNTNVTGLNNVFSAAVNSKKKPWVIFASSREVYGDQEHLPVQEDAQLKPLNVYARSKLTGEKIAQTAQLSGIQAAVIRFSNVYGAATDHETRVIPAFVRASLRDAELRVEGGQNTFDFVHISDAVDGLARVVNLMEKEKFSLPLIHFVSGKGTTLLELANTVVAIIGAGTITHHPPRNFDVSRFIGDPSRAKQILGWETKRNLNDGLRMFTNELAKHLEAEQMCPPSSLPLYGWGRPLI